MASFVLGQCRNLAEELEDLFDSGSQSRVSGPILVLMPLVERDWSRRIKVVTPDR